VRAAGFLVRRPIGNVTKFALRLVDTACSRLPVAPVTHSRVTMKTVHKAIRKAVPKLASFMLTPTFHFPNPVSLSPHPYPKDPPLNQHSSALKTET
jgi:hypothetical protein